MSLQSELNLMADEFLNPWKNGWTWNLVLLGLVSALIGFSVHGWLCIQNIIQGDKKFCEISLNIAIVLEIIFGFFILPPILMAIVLNCLYPRRLEVSRAIAPKIASHTVVAPSPLRIVRSANEFHRVKGSSMRRTSLS